MAAPLQNTADIVVLNTPAPESVTNPADIDTAAPVGLKLAAARKAKGLSHVDVHHGTKIKILHIAAIEAGERAHLPATPFTAGFVKAYAQFLGLDADAYARAYKQEAGFVPPAAPPQETIVRDLTRSPSPLQADAQALAPATVRPSAPSRGLDAEKLVTWLGVGAAIAVAAFIAGRAAEPRPTAAETAPAPVPTVVSAPPAAAPTPAPIEPPAPIAEAAPPAIEAIEPPPAVAAAKPPAVKPKPKLPKPIETPAPISETPPSILFTMLESEPAALAGPTDAVTEPLLSEADPAEVAPPAPVIVPARVARGAVAVYPERCAVRAGDKVGVSVMFSITTDGKPVSASVAASDNRCFNSAALRAVYDMRFSPRTVDGVPSIETGKSVTVQFVR